MTADALAIAKATVTREELHDMVWSAPMNAVAERFGVAEKTIRKICSTHLVPAPAAGYWETEQQIDGPQNRAKLRAVDNSALQTFAITENYRRPGGDYLATVLKEVSENSRARPKKAENRKRGTREEVQGPKTLTAKALFEKKQLSPADGKAAIGGGLHPDITRFVEEFRLRPAGRGGFLCLRGMRVPPNKVSRVDGFLRSLAERLRGDGLLFRGGEGRGERVGFGRDGSTVHFEITFPRQQEMVRSEYSDYSFREYTHIGRMRLRIYGQASGSRKTFNDSDSRTIESEVEVVAESFRLNIVGQVERDTELIAERKRWAELARRRELASLRDTREVGRIEFLREMNAVRKELEELKATIKLLEDAGGQTPEIQRMLVWTKAHFHALEVRVSSDGFRKAILERNLYPDPDPLLDPEGESPVP